MEAVLAIFVILLAAACVGICIIKPRYAIVPVLMLFPAEQIFQGYNPDLVWRLGPMVNLVVGGIALTGVAYNFFKLRSATQGMKNPVYIALIALYVYIMISILWTPSQVSVMYFLNRSWAYFFLFYVLAPMLVKDLDDLKLISMPLIVSSAVIMVLMLINPRARFVDDRFTIDLGYVIGLGTLRSNPLAIADAAGMLAILAAIYRPAKGGMLIKGIQWGGVLLGLALALLSGSRGQVIAAVGVVAILMPFATGARSALRAAGTLVVVGVMVMFLYFVFQTFVVSAAQDRWGMQGAAQGGVAQRWDMSMTLLGAYASSPAYWPMGLGAASFNEYYTLRAPDNPHWYPHNILVESIAEYGLPGLALLLIIGYFTIKNCVSLYRLAGEDRTRKSALVAFAGVILFQLVMSLKQGSLLGMPPLFMFCAILARVAKNEERAAVEAYAAEGYDAEHDAEEQPYYDDEIEPQPRPV